MPASDGATRAVSDPTREACGAQLTGEIRIWVDLWAMFTCHECVPDARENAPLSCTVFPLPRSDDDATDGDVSERTT